MKTKKVMLAVALFNQVTADVRCILEDVLSHPDAAELDRMQLLCSVARRITDLESMLWDDAYLNNHAATGATSQVPA